MPPGENREQVCYLARTRNFYLYLRNFECSSYGRSVLEFVVNASFFYARLLVAVSGHFQALGVRELIGQGVGGLELLRKFLGSSRQGVQGDCLLRHQLAQIRKFPLHL